MQTALKDLLPGTLVEVSFYDHHMHKGDVASIGVVLVLVGRIVAHDEVYTTLSFQSVEGVTERDDNCEEYTIVRSAVKGFRTFAEVV